MRVSTFASRFRRLQRLSIEELRTRLAQHFAALGERRGWSSLDKLPDDQAVLSMFSKADREVQSAEELLAYFQSRTSPKFFISFSDRDATVREFQRAWPTSAAKLIEQANRIAEGKLDLLGLKDLNFGNPIDWHLEPISGKRIPLRHWSVLDYLDPNVAGDKKIVWELNRHQYFATLGQAYWLTNDERYAETFVNHLHSWMEQNPPKLGINWASSLEVSFRTISWLWAFYFFKDSPAFTPETFARSMKFLYLSGRHLQNYLSTYFSPNTHLTGEALGLFYLGTLFPELDGAGHWCTLGREILVEQLSRHVRTDGVYFEQSSYYHRYTVDFYTHLAILSRINDEPLPMQVEEKLTALLDHLMYITRPDGTTPLFGDDDGGRLMFLSQRAPNDFRPALATGAVLFGRPDLKFVAGPPGEELLWLLAPAGVRSYEALVAQAPSKESVAFPDGGYYVMRDAWSPSSNYLLFDCGPHGTLNCGHAHADALSFELAVEGRPMLVDPGTFTYTGSQRERDWFRSSAAHNTLTLDGESSSTLAGPFSWKTIAQSRRGRWISNNRFDYVEGEHDGYLRLATPATHLRSILFLKHDYWILHDLVISNGEHRADLWFHFEPGALPHIEALRNDQAKRENEITGGLEIVILNEGEWRQENGWVSHCYGEVSNAPIYVFSSLTRGNDHLITFLLPCHEGLYTKRRVSEIESSGGRAFEIAGEDHLDLIMIRDYNQRRPIEVDRLKSDFDWTWGRFSPDEDRTLHEFVVIGGQNLSLDGNEILKSEERMNYLAGSRSDGRLHVDTDAIDPGSMSWINVRN